VSYTLSNGKFVDAFDVTLAPLASVAAGTTASPSVETGRRTTARLTLTATSGTGTLDVTVQTSRDGVTWRTAGTFAQLTGAGSEPKCFAGLDRYVRLSSAVGTGPFVFSVAGELV
jgi:hypothetical protein